jgi:hypothetical protein
MIYTNKGMLLDKVLCDVIPCVCPLIDHGSRPIKAFAFLTLLYKGQLFHLLKINETLTQCCNFIFTACLPGQMYSLTLAKCEPCPKKTYQPLDGQLDCISCQSNTITKNSGSTRREDCVQCKYIMRFKAT